MQVLIKDGKAIKKILTRMNKSLGWLAEQISIDPSYLTRILSRERNVSPGIRDRLMDVLGVSVWDDLFEEVDKDIDEKVQPMPI